MCYCYYINSHYVCVICWSMLGCLLNVDWNNILLSRGSQTRQAGGVKLTSLVPQLAHISPAQSPEISASLSQLSEQKMEETTPIVGFGDGGGDPGDHEVEEEEEEEEEVMEESRYGWLVVAASFLCNVVIDGK